MKEWLMGLSESKRISLSVLLALTIPIWWIPAIFVFFISGLSSLIYCLLFGSSVGSRDINVMRPSGYQPFKGPDTPQPSPPKAP